MFQCDKCGRSVQAITAGTASPSNNGIPVAEAVHPVEVLFRSHHPTKSPEEVRVVLLDLCYSCEKEVAEAVIQTIVPLLHQQVKAELKSEGVQPNPEITEEAEKGYQEAANTVGKSGIAENPKGVDLGQDVEVDEVELTENAKRWIEENQGCLPEGTKLGLYVGLTPESDRPPARRHWSIRLLKWLWSWIW